VSEITNAAQAHFEVVVLPAVAPSVADHGAAAAALLALLRGAEEGVTAVLRRAVDVFIAQVVVASGFLGAKTQTRGKPRTAW
jgi:hypothetical protein